MPETDGKTKARGFRLSPEAERNLRDLAQNGLWNENQALNLILEGKVKFEAPNGQEKEIDMSTIKTLYVVEEGEVREIAPETAATWVVGGEQIDMPSDPDSWA